MGIWAPTAIRLTRDTARLKESTRRHGDVAPVRGAMDAGPADRLLSVGRVVVRVDGVDVLVVMTRRRTFGIENQCPHMDRPLTDAEVSGRPSLCIRHERRYDPKSGRPLSFTTLRASRIRIFDASIVDNRLWLAPRSNETPKQRCAPGLERSAGA
jgi:nitrite reductase/ring-hydroxylating ferredoxin subunit